MHPIFSKVQETIKVLDKVRICLVYQACNELCLIIIFSLSHPANANYSINNGWVDIILLSNYPNRSIGSALLFLIAVHNTDLIIDRIPTDYIHVSYTLCVNRSNRGIRVLPIFANIWACATVGVEHKYTLVTCVDQQGHVRRIGTVEGRACTYHEYTLKTMFFPANRVLKNYIDESCRLLLETLWILNGQERELCCYLKY